MESALQLAEIVGVSRAATALRAFVESAASNEKPVLLIGERGAGKQLVARAIHSASARCEQPLLMIDCSLYYERELKRELFGFGGDGAAGKERCGVLKHAVSGTCYLSHIEEMTPVIQEAILEFLQTGKFRRLGDGKEIASNVRLIASSDRNIEGFVRSGLFRGGLYTALGEQEHHISPLRDRREDIPLLIDSVLESFLTTGRAKKKSEFLPETLDALQSYPWPSNLEELHAEILRLVDAGINTVQTEHLSMEIANFWLGLRGDPDTRRVLEELDGYIREFRILSRIGCEFGDATVEGGCWTVTDHSGRDDLAEL